MDLWHFTRQRTLWRSLAAIALVLNGSCLFSQSPLLSLSSAVAVPGSTVSLSLSLSVFDIGPAGLEWTLAYPATQLSVISVVAGPAATAAGKAVSCAANSGAYTCLLTGLNTNAISSGVIANVQVMLARDAASAAVTLTNATGADAAANGLSIVSASPAVIEVPTLTALNCVPVRLSAGGSGACSLSLNTAAPAGGVIVTLATDNPLLTVPPSVQASAGASAVSFGIRAADAISGNQSAVVLAFCDGSTKSLTIALGAVSGPPPTLTLTPSSMAFVTAGGRAASQLVSLAGSVPGAAYTAFAVTASGAGWLTVSPGTGQVNAQSVLTVAVDPSGLSAGTYTGTVNVSGDSGAFASAAVTMNVDPTGRLIVSPSAITFTYDRTTASMPVPQGISVLSNPAGASFAAAASPESNWLSVASTSGNAPASFPVSVNAANLAPGSYTAEISITSSVADPVQIPVTLSVVSAPPKLSVPALTQRFALLRTGNPATGQVVVMNAGGGTLRFSAGGAVDRGQWLSLTGGVSGSATAATPAIVGFVLDPTGLDPGIYSGRITVQDTDSSDQAVVTVILAVSQAREMVTLSQTGLKFTAVQNAQNPPAQSLVVNTQGSSAADWTAQAQTLPNSQAAGINWLSVSSNSSAGGPDVRLTVAVDHAGLPPGQYYGSIGIAGANAVNNPQSVSVLLNVLPANSPSPGVEFSTGGLIFTGVSGSQTSQQLPIGIFNPLSTPLSYSTAVFLQGGAGWLTLSSPSGALLPGANTLSVQTNFAGVSPGIQRGTISIAFGDGSVRTAQVEAIAMGGNICQGGRPALLAPVFQEPQDGAVLVAAAAQTLRVQAVDDCGNILSQSNGDAVQIAFGGYDVPLDLHDAGGGIWEGTWVPATPSARVALQSIAFRKSTGLKSVGTVITATVQPGDSQAAGQISGVVNAAMSAQAPPRVVAPGSYIAVYGANLTPVGVNSATATPLPTSLNGVRLLLGDKSLPLLYASPTQVNAQVPQALNVNTEYQLTVERGATRSVPVELLVAGLQPGIYTRDQSGSGPGIAEIAGTMLLAGPVSSVSRPVQRGSEYLVVYCTGLGPVLGSNGEAAPPDGAAASNGFLYQTRGKTTASIGGVDAPVVFSGLTPSLVGLYQVNVQVPAGAPTGDALPLVISVIDPQTGAAVQSNAVTVAVQ